MLFVFLVCNYTPVKKTLPLLLINNQVRRHIPAGHQTRVTSFPGTTARVSSVQSALAGSQTDSVTLDNISYEIGIPSCHGSDHDTSIAPKSIRLHFLLSVRPLNQGFSTAHAQTKKGFRSESERRTRSNNSSACNLAGPLIHGGHVQRGDTAWKPGDLADETTIAGFGYGDGMETEHLHNGEILHDFGVMVLPN